MQAPLAMNFSLCRGHRQPFGEGPTPRHGFTHRDRVLKATHSSHATHTSHSTAHSSWHFLLLFWNLDNDTLSGGEQRGDTGRVDKGRPNNLHRQKNTLTTLKDQKSTTINQHKPFCHIQCNVIVNLYCIPFKY